MTVTSLTIGTSHFESVIVHQAHRWPNGSTVTVAFNGGSPDLYAHIEQAASGWMQPGFANLHFAFRDASGKWNQWSATDTEARAQIRITFLTGDQGGYWSVIGTDSVDPTIRGGKPGDASMNFEGFDKALPSDWAGVVKHEFGHALGLEHEHQNPAITCDFRFENDAGYVQRKDADGWFIPDVNGKRPGLYTYLGGYANFWDRAKVDFNLRALPNSRAFDFSAFDNHSIMKYYFDPSMFITGEKSACYSGAENMELSNQDQMGIHAAYSGGAPSPVAALQTLVEKAPAHTTLREGLLARIATLKKMVTHRY